MNNLEADEGTKQLVASEKSAGAKGDDVDANAGMGDISSGNPEK
jgi:hypothetical protein